MSVPLRRRRAALGAILVGLLLEVGARAEAALVITPDAKSVNPGILSFTVTSDYQKGPTELEVLLPAGYSAQKRYPVVYMLPVNTGTSGPWGSSIVEAKKDNLQNQYQAIFVAPAYVLQPWFGDNPDEPDVRQNLYITDVVIPFIDHHFATTNDAQGRYLIGFSKAGLGAWALFLMHLDLFNQVAIFDSYLGPPTEEQWTTWGLKETYGTRLNYDRYDPLLLLEKAKAVLQKEPRRITLLGGGPGSRIGVDLYHTKLQDDKIPYIYVQGSDMTHNWTSGWLPLALAGLMDPPLPGAPPK